MPMRCAQQHRRDSCCSNSALVSTGGGVLRMAIRNLRHVLEVAQFERAWIESELLPETLRLKQASPVCASDVMRGRRMASLLFQESLLTASSFAEAMEVLGGRVREFRPTDLSPEARAQSIEDAVRILSAWHFDALM